MRLSDITNGLQKEQIEPQKDHAKRILKEVSENFDYALIAGGAPRNWSFNILANDFDIYVSRKICCNEEEQKEVDENIQNGIDHLSSIFGSLGENRANKEISSNPYGGLILSHLYDFIAPEFPDCSSHSQKKQKCQLIVIDDHSEDIIDFDSFSKRIFSTFDFGICMTSMDKDGNFYNSPMFNRDKKNKTFTVNISQLKRNNQSGMEKLVERFEKMEQYFPDHKMRISI